jgi:hypothetical protein
MPHTWAVATSVVPVSELIGRDFEFEEIVGLIAAHRLMVPTVMAKHTPGLSEIVRHDHRAKARKVEGGARQRRPYVDVEDPGSADRARREVGRAAVDRGGNMKEFVLEGRLTLERVTFYVSAKTLEGALARAANGDFDGYETDAAQSIDCHMVLASIEDNI